MSDRLRVLLVDDSPFDRGMVRRELSREFSDVEFCEVTNDSEFRRALDRRDFDLVITDYQIRWTDGIQVFEKVRACVPDCPVLMFTATGGEEVAVEAMKAGLDDYVIKNARHMVRLTAAVRAVLEHHRTQARAHDLESRLSSLLAQLRVGVFRRNSLGEIVEANDSAARILGASSAAELKGENLNRFPTPALPHDSPPTFSDSPVGGMELYIRKLNGESVWLSVSETSANDRTGLIDGLLEDVSERKHAEENVLRLQDEVAHIARINTMAEMAAGIAHELTQPLTVITSLASVCLDTMVDGQPAEPEQHRRWLQQMHDLAFDSGQVLRGLNEFTRHRPRDPKPTDLSDLIRRTLEMLRFTFRRTAIQTVTRLPERGPVLTVDPVQMRQVFLNLARNNVSAMQENARDDRVLTVSVSQQSDQVIIQFKDTGPGIPGDRLERLFQPFLNYSKSGTGLGLSISARIVEAHHGRLTGFNHEDGGSVFQVTLPVQSPDPSEAEE